MESERINYVVSPEVLNRDIFELNYDGNTFGLYSGMSQVLSSGVNGSSLLTGLTIPILFTYSFNDLGFYDEFDGFIDQQDTINNFYISGNSIQPYQVTIYNTAGFGVNNYLALSNYSIDWGDGANTSTVNIKENTQVHTYSQVPQEYSIKMTQNNIWGTTEIIKKITLPFTGVTVDNQLGTVTFTQQGGKWSGIPINYNYIFTGDSNSNLNYSYVFNYNQVFYCIASQGIASYDSLISNIDLLYDPVKVVTNTNVISEPDPDKPIYKTKSVIFSLTAPYDDIIVTNISPLTTISSEQTVELLDYWYLPTDIKRDGSYTTTNYINPANDPIIVSASTGWINIGKFLTGTTEVDFTQSNVLRTNLYTFRGNMNIKIPKYQTY